MLLCHSLPQQHNPKPLLFCAALKKNPKSYSSSSRLPQLLGGPGFTGGGCFIHLLLRCRFFLIT